MEVNYRLLSVIKFFPRRARAHGHPIAALIIFLITHRLITSFFRVRVVLLCPSQHIVYTIIHGRIYISLHEKRDDDDDCCRARMPICVLLKLHGWQPPPLSGSTILILTLSRTPGFVIRPSVGFDNWPLAHTPRVLFFHLAEEKERNLEQDQQQLITEAKWTA